MRYYEIVILATAALGDGKNAQQLLDRYREVMFPWMEKQREKDAQEAKQLLEQLKDVTFVINSEKTTSKPIEKTGT